MSGGQYKCNACDYEGDADDHGCPGTPDARITALEAQIEELREEIQGLFEKLQQAGIVT